MIDILGSALGVYLALGQRGENAPVDRPRFTSNFNCALGLMLARPEMEKHSLDPARFECVLDGETWIIQGKKK